MFRTSNPALRNPVFSATQTWDDYESRYGSAGGASAPDSTAGPVDASRHVMTINGTVTRTFFLLTMCTATSVFSYTKVLDGGMNPLVAMVGGGLVGFIAAMICSFAPRSSPFAAPVYALSEGFFLGSLSALYAMQFATPGDAGEPAALNQALVFNAFLLTFGVAGGVLAAYATKLVRPNRTFYNIVIAGTLGLVLYIPIAFIAALCGAPGLLSVYDPANGGLISIGFSLLAVGLASANLVLDFDLVNNAVKNRADKRYEWYAGFAILVTLVWLYVEMLRLLAKLRRE